MTSSVSLLLVVLCGEIGGHRESRLELHDYCGVCRGCHRVAAATYFRATDLAIPQRVSPACCLVKKEGMLLEG